MNEYLHLWFWYTPFQLGGVETFLQRITRAAIDAGITSTVAAIQSSDGPFRNQYDGRVELADWTSFYPAFMGKVPMESFEAAAVRDLSRWRPGVIWLNGAVDFSLGTVPLLRRLRPYCTIVDAMHADSPEKGYLEHRKPYVDLLDGVISSSRRALDRFENELSPRATLPARYIPYGIPTAAAPRTEAGETLRLLWSGRLEQAQKRVFDLVPMLRALREAGRPFRLTVAGDGPERASLESRFREERLDSQVRFEGSVPPDRMPELYATHDVLVNLSAYEGFSISVMEALAGGCVPMVTDLPGLDREALRDGVNCIVVPVADPESAARGLAALSAGSIERLSAAASATGREFTLEKCLASYLDLVAEARRRRPLQAWPEDAAAVLSGPWDMTKHNPWIPHPHPLRRFIGRNILDLPRYALRLATPRLAKLIGQPWQTLHNRGEKTSRRPGQRGVVCDWRWTSSLFYCQLRPNAGRRLLDVALAEWPIRLSPGDSPAPAGPLVSFVVGHRGAARIPHLELTLRSLLGQRDVASEVIVVEQDSESVLAGRLPAGVRHVLTPPPTPGMPYSRSWAFNVGAREARGRILVFHDNDTMAPAAYASELVRVFAEGFVAARLQRFVFYLSAEQTDRIFSAGQIRPDAAPDRVEQNCQGATIAVERETYFALGGHDEGFVGWGGEDNEFFDRLKTVKLHDASYLPFVHLWHPAAPGKWAPNDNVRRFEERIGRPRESRIAELSAELASK